MLLAVLLLTNVNITITISIVMMIIIIIIIHLIIIIIIIIIISSSPEATAPGHRGSPASRRGQDKRFLFYRSAINSHNCVIIMVYCGTSEKTAFVLTPFGSR